MAEPYSDEELGKQLWAVVGLARNERLISAHTMQRLCATVERLQRERDDFKRQAQQYHAMYDRLYQAGGLDPELADSDALDLIALLESSHEIGPSTRAMLVHELKQLLRLRAKHADEVPHG